MSDQAELDAHGSERYWYWCGVCVNARCDDCQAILADGRCGVGPGTCDKPAGHGHPRGDPHDWRPMPTDDGGYNGWYCGVPCEDGEPCGVIWSAAVHSIAKASAYIRTGT